MPNRFYVTWASAVILAIALPIAVPYVLLEIEQAIGAGYNRLRNDE